MIEFRDYKKREVKLAFRFFMAYNHWRLLCIYLINVDSYEEYRNIFTKPSIM